MRCPLTKRGLLLVLGLFVTSLTSAWANECVELDLPSQIKYSKAIFIGTVVGTDQGELMTKFHVTEAFKGVKGDYVDVGPVLGFQIHFANGEQYLVFAGGCSWVDAEKGCLAAGICSGTHLLECAQATLEQLRAERSGRALAPVYGTLMRTSEGFAAIWEKDFERPLPHVLVRIKSDKQSFETRTDGYGSYFFHHVPPGKYEVSAELPPNLELGATIGTGAPPPFELDRGSCARINLYALPTGRISGKVIGPDGKPLNTAGVELYRANRYNERQPGLIGFQGKATPTEDWKPFEFNHLPAGDYVLVFNRQNTEEPYAPFPRTFSPDAPDRESAVVIHLAEGQQISDTDIHILAASLTR
ncbi:MAG: carboxypeptidase-like regulatory domain-containing protein [Acidobacteriota bacterium]|nr:carboxypeptidase-like regulatory domain-containing protein [Acidobacteriota bacterium]